MSERLAETYWPIPTEREVSMLEALTAQAQYHVDRSEGQLYLLDVDRAENPGQLGCQVRGEPLDQNTINDLASQYRPCYPKMVRQLRVASEERGIGTEIKSILNRGGSLIIATNHAELVDIAFIQAAVNDLVADGNIGHRNAIILGKTASRIGANLAGARLPIVDALRWLCDDIYLSWPRSESLRQTGLEEKYAEDIRQHNRTVRAKVKEALDVGRLILGLAASGTTDRETGPGHYEMGRVGAATAAMLRHPNAWVLPIAAWSQDGKVLCKPVDQPTRLGSDYEVHVTMMRIAHALSGSETGKSFHYPTLRRLTTTS